MNRRLSISVSYCPISASYTKPSQRSDFFENSHYFQFRNPKPVHEIIRFHVLTILLFPPLDFPSHRHIDGLKLVNSCLPVETGWKKADISVYSTEVGLSAGHLDREGRWMLPV